MADHPATRIVLLVLAGGQALIGAFVLGLAVNIGVSGVDDGRRPWSPSVQLEAPLPTGSIRLDGAVLAGGRAFPGSVAVGSDGNVWFATSGPPSGPGIGQIDKAGTVRHFPTPTVGDLAGIAVAPDGAVWFADPVAPAIGRRSASGTVTRFTVGPGSPRAVRRIATAMPGSPSRVHPLATGSGG